MIQLVLDVFDYDFPKQLRWTFKKKEEESIQHMTGSIDTNTESNLNGDY